MPLTWIQFLTHNQTDNLQASIFVRWFIQPAAWMYFEEQFPPSCFIKSLLNKWTATRKIQLTLPFIPTAWCYLQTCHWISSIPAVQELNIQEQGKASAGSSSFTSVFIISSAFLASQKTPYFPLECSTLWQGKCNLLKCLRWKSKADLLLEPPAQIPCSHLHLTRETNNNNKKNQSCLKS